MEVFEILVVTRFPVGNAMTYHVIAKDLRMDKLAVCLRLGDRNFDALHIINDLLGLFIERGEGMRLKSRRYQNTRYPSSVVQIPLCPNNSTKLIVESGCATDWNGIPRPYAKFEFNAQRLAIDYSAKNRFLSTLLDLIPSGGYPVLLEDGYLLQAELSADFRGIAIESLDAYSPRMEQGLYFYRGGALKTISLHDGKLGRPEAFCIYDKKLADKEQRHHIRHGPLLRVEARRRFNRTARYRTLKFHELPNIENPFADLCIYERSRIDEMFTAARHQRFLSAIHSSGVQAALSGTRGADRERRLRMLECCKASWWNPQRAWDGIYSAVTEGLLR